MMTFCPQRGAARWVVSTKLIRFPLQFSGESPDLEAAVRAFVQPLAGGEETAADDTLEFFLAPLAAVEPQQPRGRKTPIQFAAIACYEEERLLFFAARDGSFLEADIERGRAWGRVSHEAATAKRYVLADLLMAPLMEMLKLRGFYGLHASAVLRDGVGYLLPGGTESGKTTTALSLIKSGFGYLADDKVLLESSDSGISAHAFTRRFNIDPSIAGAYSEWSFLSDRDPLPLSHKVPVDVSTVYPGSFVGRFRPNVIVHLERTHDRGSAIQPIPISESFRRLTQQTILAARKETAQRQLRLLSRLLHGTRSYVLLNGRDLYGSPERLCGFLQNCL